MKKHLIFTVLFAACCLGFAKDFGDTEISIYNEVQAAFETGFYPGTVEKAVQLESDFPESAFVLPALLQKGQALFYLGQLEDAEQTFKKCLSKIKDDDKAFAKVHFWLGKVYTGLENRTLALENFHNACVYSQNQKESEYYNYSVFYSAQLFFVMENFSEAVKLYEYVVQNGNFYQQKDYEQALQNLCGAYNKSQNPQKTVLLVQKFEQQTGLKNDSLSDNQTASETIQSAIGTNLPVSQNVFWKLQFSKAQAYEQLQDYKNAYDVYIFTTENAPSDFAVLALKKAYVIANSKFDYVNAEQFEKSILTAGVKPELAQAFWVRLGIDEYNQKNAKKALEYFEKAPQNGVTILYKNKIALDQKQSAAEVEKNLRENEQIILTCVFENISDSYYSLLLTCCVLQNKWEQAAASFGNLCAPVPADKYLYAAALYEQGKFAEGVEFLETQAGVQNAAGDYGDFSLENVKILELYGSCLANTANVQKANDVYKKLYDAGVLSEKSQLEYAKNIFRAGSYKSALNVASALIAGANSNKNAASSATSAAAKSAQSDAVYICGLCCVNLKNWEQSRTYFAQYIKNQSNKSDFNKLALFYKGYSEYSLELYKDSYASFARFGMEAEKSLETAKYARKSYEFAAKSALQNGDFVNAATQAQNVVRCSANLEEKQEAILFCAQINSDYGNFSRAIEILGPYTKQKGDFALQATFETAKIYEKQGNLQEADKLYTQIYTKSAAAPLAEEAMYRSGEIFYAAGDFASAQSRLNKYVYKYVDGRFTESALFYCADSFLNLGENEKAIMMHKNLIQKYPQSVFLYGAYKNLLTAYYETQDYLLALDAAKFLVKQFPDQAASDGIGTKLKEIEKIINGTDRQLVELYASFEKQGKSATVQGRKTGTQLVQLYAQNEDTKKDAYNLAMELLLLQTDVAERYEAAQNSEFLGDFLWANGENSKAAEYYLKAAEFYRGSQNGGVRAAVVLYGAAEAFVAAGQNLDAQETAKLLIELYPESKQAKNVRRLVEGM